MRTDGLSVARPAEQRQVGRGVVGVVVVEVVELERDAFGAAFEAAVAVDGDDAGTEFLESAAA
jgi:hypothetical protein